MSLWCREVSEGVVGKVNPPIGKLQMKAGQRPAEQRTKQVESLGVWEKREAGLSLKVLL